MIHYFNPGHETAVLNASKHFHPPAHIIKMQTDLAFLPACYAAAGDYVFVENSLPDDFSLSIKQLNFQINQVTPADFVTNPEKFKNSIVFLWGISPHSIHFFEKINEQCNLSLVIPKWNNELSFLGSRFASQKLLVDILNLIPGIEQDILPQFFSNIESIEKQTVQSNDRLLVKSPYSSSGRGLIWLPHGKLAQSEKQILNGMLKKQGQVSIEKVLNKCLDFSMQFENTTQGETQFIGYSIFHTNSKGAYEKNLLTTQKDIENKIINYIEIDLLLQTRTVLKEMIHKMYTPYYKGIIGVDMMIYQSENMYRLHPCVEINMRYNMGYLAIRLAERYLHPYSKGEFFIEYNHDPQIIIQKHKRLQKQHPLISENGLIRCGYFNLCPITETTNYHAYIIIVNCEAIDEEIREALTGYY